jgi:hypothetical protein
VNESFATGIQVEDGSREKLLVWTSELLDVLPKQPHISNSRLEIVKFNTLKFISVFVSSVVLCEVEST